MKTEHIDLLLVEDNPGDVRLFKEMLAGAGAEGVSLVVAGRLEDATATLARQACDVVLLDLMLPDSQGFDTFERLHATAAEVPVVVLSGTNDEALAFQVVQKGAQDYLVKGQISGQMLLRAVRYAIERSRLQCRLAQAQKRLLEAERLRVLVETAGAAAHEINQPLMAIFGYIDLLLLDMPADHAWRADVESVRDAAGRIHATIQKMNGVQHYVTKPYVDDIAIVDFDASASGRD